MDRRRFLQGAAAAGISGSLGCASMGAAPSKGRVVVIGGGYGGATAAKYVRLFSGGAIDVTLVEPGAAFVSCPISNLVIGGTKTLADLTTSYDALSSRHGVRRVRDSATGIDAAGKTVKLASGEALAYDKLIVSPGIDLMYDRIEGLQAANAGGQILQAWKAGPETVALRAQLEAMPDGGVYAITIPEAPYRCPPGPYERACQVASYFKRAKPRSKVLILDANQDVTSKGPLFKRVWAEQYKGMVEYRPQHNASQVDARSKTVKFEVQQDVRADVLNVLPPMRAGSIAVQTGLANVNGRWCNLDYQTFESTAMKDVHVIGDSIQIAPLMPKSGHMANAQAKVAAAAVVARLLNIEVNPVPMLTNTCYSFVDDKNVIHVASVHRYDADKKTFLTVPGSGGVSAGPTEVEGQYALSWARNIWADTLG
ncbi:MAG TPA: NAD(P)/FAD-dependent oxidoreductase [Burkholderiales bacterium]|nr:NAD(P)/FAD-dependent oxidoreductase [Burkholderiales bacterium]